MALINRLELTSVGPGVAQNSSGAVVANANGSLTYTGTSTPVPIWTAATGGTETTNGAFVTDSQGRIPGWVDRLAIETWMDITIPPSGPVTVPIPPAFGIVASKIVTASTYTFVLDDIGTVVEGSSSSAQTFTIPPNVFPTGGTLEAYQLGAGQLTIAAGAGVTLQSDANHVNVFAQYGSIGLRHRGSNVWALSGDLG